MSSILNDVKHQLGLLPDDDAFDETLIMHINTVFTFLNQFGAGPAEGFQITGDTETWDDFTEDVALNSVKSYIYLRVRLLFDPPGTGFTQQSFDRQIEMMEFRILSDTDF